MPSLTGGAAMQAKLDAMAKNLTKASRLDVGFLAGATYPDGTSVPLVAALDEFGTAKMPARPFFRNMIAAKSDGWPDAVAGLLVANNYDAERTLNLTGEGIKGQLQESIRTFAGAPLSPRTIKAKGFDKQLVNTGHMLNSVGYQVTTSDDRARTAGLAAVAGALAVGEALGF